MAQKDKNQWIDSVMGSLDGLQRAEPGDFAFGKIESRIKEGTTPLVRGRVIPLRMVSAVAASLLILVAINIACLTNKPKQANNDSVRSVAKYYGLTDDNITDAL